MKWYNQASIVKGPKNCPSLESTAWKECFPSPTGSTSTRIESMKKEPTYVSSANPHSHFLSEGNDVPYRHSLIGLRREYEDVSVTNHRTPLNAPFFTSYDSHVSSPD